MSQPIVSDELWALVAPLLPPEPPRPRGGRPRSIPNRAALTGILFVLKSGIPWEMLPQELGCGSGMTCWRRLHDWLRAGVWRRLHHALLQRLHDAGQLDWERASLDSASVPAPGGGEQTGKDPTNRGKLGTKRHIVVDRHGVPLAVTISTSNVHDSQRLEEAVDAIPALRLPHRRRATRASDPRSRMPTRRTTSRAAAMHYARAASPPASRVAVSNRASALGGIGGWWSARSRGSTASDGSRCATSGGPTSTKPS